MKLQYIQGINGIIMHMLRELKNNQSGVASLITVLFVSILLSIIVLGFIRVAINEQRQATDDDLSTRAFYAAEAGIEDAKRAVQEELRDVTDTFDINADTCAAPTGYDNVISESLEFDVEYTCMLIDMTPPTYETFLTAGESTVVRLEGVSGFTQVVLRWHDVGGGPSDDGAYVARGTSDTNLPPEGSWGHPAMLRAYYFKHDNPITRAGLNSSATLAFLNPTDAASSTINLNGPQLGQNLAVYNAACGSASAGYACEVLYRTNASEQDYIRLTSLYRSTHVQIELRNSPSATIDFKSGQQVLVDITGRAADVYRRVEARLDLNAGLDDLIPDYAIFSGDDICKNYGVTDTQFIAGPTVAGICP